MSIKAIVTVLEHSKQRATALVLMIVVADFINDYGEAWPSIDTLARKARADRSTVIELLKKAETEHELQLERGAGPRGTNRYRLGDHYRRLGWESESPTPTPTADKGQSGPATSGGVGIHDGSESDGSESDPILKEPKTPSQEMESSVNNGSGRKSPPRIRPVGIGDVVIPDGYFRCSKCGGLIAEGNRDTKVADDCRAHSVRIPAGGSQ